jgi:hypothetical protein
VQIEAGRSSVERRCPAERSTLDILATLYLLLTRSPVASDCRVSKEAFLNAEWASCKTACEKDVRQMLLSVREIWLFLYADEMMGAL